MKLLDNETKALQKSKPEQQVCAWRTDEPQWREGTVYKCEGVGEVTVVLVRRMRRDHIKLVDIKRSGWQGYDRLVEALGGTRHEDEIWEVRIVKGDVSGKPRLLKHAGGRAGASNFDYVDGLGGGRSMKGEPEALNEEQLRDIDRRSTAEREAAVEDFKRRTVEEATTLFRGEDALRNFTRIMNSLGKTG